MSAVVDLDEFAEPRRLITELKHSLGPMPIFGYCRPKTFRMRPAYGLGHDLDIVQIP